MAKRRLEIISLLLFLCLCLMPCRVQAASTADAAAPLSPHEECALTLCYVYDGMALSEVPVKLYRVAEVSADFQYSLTDAFAATGLELNGIQSAGEWDAIRSTLEAYILSQGIEADAAGITDQEGKMAFAQLSTGLYLAISEDVVKEDGQYVFDAAMISLPGLGADGLWQYGVTVNCKAEMLPPITPDEWKELRVLKLWKDEGKQGNRPNSIEVEIFCNGETYQTVTLSEENLWSYTWTVKQDGADWLVMERNVPEGYTVTVEERTEAFVLTNTFSEEPTVEDPETGDRLPVLLYVVLLYVSGMALLLLGIIGKRKQA